MKIKICRIMATTFEECPFDKEEFSCAWLAYITEKNNDTLYICSAKKCIFQGLWSIGKEKDETSTTIMQDL